MFLDGAESAAIRLFLVVALSFTPRSCGTSSGPQPVSSEPNFVAAFFSHADRQYETAGQQKEIIRALQDMLDKSPEQLRRLRYADYQGKENSWPLTTLIKSYFVPTQPVAAWDEERFYRDVAKPEAKAAIREQLSEVQKEAPAH